MNYELALQLKNAGFPHVWSKDFDNAEVKHDHPINCACLPTLSKLIEACGDDFMLTNECGEWDAWSNQGAEMTYPVRMGESGAKYMCTGKTPEEAVANLWLKLHPNE